MIKLEVYEPSFDIKNEPGVLSLYGYNFSALLLEKGCMFSEKIYALLNRCRGRDIYDTLLMLKKRFPIDENVLHAHDINGSPQDIILKHLRSLPEKELRFLSEQIRPFLFKEDDIELILKAPEYAERFLDIYD